MTPLRSKLQRDLWHYRGPLGAIVAVTFCGVALFVAMRSMFGHLRYSRDAYYASYRLGDVFAQVKRAPAAVGRQIASLPGVQDVNTRIVTDVTLDVPGLAEPATGRLVSIPAPAARMLNRLHLSKGRWPRADAAEVVASVAFCAANQLQPGDSIGAVMNGRWEWLRIVGTGMSPEYVYEIGGTGIFPDNRRFGVLWMAEGSLSDAMAMEGAFNDVVLTLAPNASAAPIMAAVDRVLAPYGSGGSFARRDLMSVQFLDGEIDETQVTSILLPGIFLGVTAFLLHIVLSRLVSMQREQIAVLKAFGYGNASIGLHYLALAGAPVGIGAAAGAGCGVWLAAQFAVVYARFFQFPSAAFRPSAGVLTTAVVIALLAALVGALSAVLRCVGLPPAEAMRPEAPADYSRLRVSAARWVSSPVWRIIGRNLERRPGRTALTIVGLALAVGLVTTVGAMFDAIEFMKVLQFDLASREDLAVGFSTPLSDDAVRAIGRMPGVLAVEPYRAVPVRLRSQRRASRVAIIGTPPEAGLHRIVDDQRLNHRPPPDGLMVSSVLAHMLDVRPGDRVVVEVLEGRRAQRVVTVVAVVNDLFGATAYMQPDALERLVGDGEAVSGVYVAATGRQQDSLLSQLKRMPGVGGVRVRAAELAAFERTIAESFVISLVVALVFACVIAFGIVYNGARIALSERGRELASLRVLGFTRREVTTMLLGEQAILTLLSIPLGFGIAFGLSWLVSVRFESDLYRIPIVAAPSTYLFGASVVAASALLSAVAVRGRVRGLDLVAVLKTRE